MNSKGVFALSMAALIATATAVAHLSCIVIGPACFEAQLAPPEIVQSSIDGTLLAPVTTVIIATLFLAWALFAISAAGFIKKLPLLNIALVAIAALCLLRGLATIPSSYVFPEMVSTYSIIAGFIWFLEGVLFLYGYWCIRKAAAPTQPVKLQ